MPRRPSPPTKPTAQRNFLSLAIKVEICKMASRNPTMQPGALGVWATNKFESKFEIDRCMVFKALRQKDKLLALSDHHLSRKTIPANVMVLVDADVKAWVEKIVVKYNRVTAHQVCKHARRMCTKHGVPEAKMPKFTKAWVTRFMHRNQLKHATLFGEAASVKKAAIVAGRARMQELTRFYHPDDIFNFDESAYFYRRKATRTIAPIGMVVRGEKKDKSRVTMAVGTNCSGTERLPLLIIGTAKMPVPFRANASRVHWVGDKTRQPVNPLFHYAHSRKGWMNGDIFRAWLRELDDRMRNRDRSILLLVDNVSSHVVGDLELTNVRLDFLPKNTTSVLQPMDQGIIKATKDYIYRLRDERDYDFYIQDVPVLPLTDLFTACEWCAASFGALSEKTIKNAWKKANIVVDRSNVMNLWL